LIDALSRVELPDGAELHYIDRGRGNPVIFLHGGMGDCDAWASQLCALEKSARVIAYSRRYNHPNRNPRTDAPHSIESDIADLYAFMRQLLISRAHLVGTSYGALIALAFAIRHPQSVQSLALAEPPLHRWACRTVDGAALCVAFMTSTWEPAAAAFASNDERHAVQLLTDGIWGAPVFDTLAPNRQAAMLRNAASMRALTQSHDPFPDLSRAGVASLAIPMVLIRGEHASALHVCVNQELARVVPGADHVVIERAGHGSPVENADRFNDVLRVFLGERTP
jgi:pimeloyl-ACP methyl ester carboxylesterase